MSRVTPTERGPGRTPACAKCGHNRKVVRLWLNGNKVWACTEHFRFTTSEAEERTLKQRLLRKPIEAKTVSITSTLPNRAARRKARLG